MWLPSLRGAFLIFQGYYRSLSILARGEMFDVSKESSAPENAPPLFRQYLFTHSLTVVY